ncbi:MAG: hydroxyacid dehydrogenase [Omnitrophica WOR_2 bacterium GWA2_47_8]|nr:MAG: hydroxyacid dehydrogenase [Omnitrophica WOR_2 bacterium GWA2_47_8]
MKVVINTSNFGEHDTTPLEKLKQAKWQYALNPYKRQLTEKEVIELSQDAVGLIAGNEPLNKHVLTNLKAVKVISRCGVGKDNIDLTTAEKLGIKVFCTPNGPTLAVAELTVGLILNLLRKINGMDADVRSGLWKKQMGYLLKDKKVGIVGFGRIGQKVAQLLSVFGAEVGYCDIQKITCEIPCRSMPFEELLKWADIVSLHLFAREDGKPIINAKELKLMQKGSWLINVARGSLVDEEALYEALKSDHLSGAALDVFSHEPYQGRLKTLNNVILTPHIGSYAVESRIEMELQAVENLIAGFKGGSK